MSTQAIDALHDVHTATNDVLKGYREMLARAEPDIHPVIRRLTEMHERHTTELAVELDRMQAAYKDDTSLQGSVNRAVVILRDWVSNLDRDALPAVRDGEKSLRDEYDKALRDGAFGSNPAVMGLLQSQRDAIDREIATLPRD